MFILFCVLQAIVQVFIWAVLIWFWTTAPYFPELSSYPLIDLATKIHVLDEFGNAPASHATNADLRDASGDKAIRKALRHRRVRAADFEPKVQPAFSSAREYPHAALSPVMAISVTRSRTA
jgi:hypothetical protein